MKKALSIILALTLALSLAVTALADEKTEPPTGDNVVKLTDPSVGENYNGDIYLVFSQLIKAVPDPERGEEYVDYHIPAGSTVTLYWYHNGYFMSLDPDKNIHNIFFYAYVLAFGEAGGAYPDEIFPEEKFNEDGTETLTFVTPGTYYYDAMTPIGGWSLSPKPLIIVEEASSDTPTPTPDTPTTPDTPAAPTFTDVPEWCAEAAEYMAEHNLMNGTGAGKFSPREKVLSDCREFFQTHLCARQLKQVHFHNMQYLRR